LDFSSNRLLSKKHPNVCLTKEYLVVSGSQLTGMLHSYLITQQ